MTQSQCDEALQGTIAEADEKGCAAQVDSMLECVLSRWTSCDPPKDACPSESDALDACEHPAQEECLMGHGGNQFCSMLCLDWEMRCQLDGTSTLVCKCTKGPHMDEAISIDSCQSFSTDFARQHCS